MVIRDLIPRRFVRPEGLLVVSRVWPDRVVGVDTLNRLVIEPGKEVNEWAPPGRGIRWLGRVWRFRPVKDWRPPA